MKPFNYVESETVTGVVTALSQGNARVIAGGSDLIGELKEGIAQYSTLVSLASAGDALRRIERNSVGVLKIGAMVTIAELEVSPELTGPHAMFAEAARSVATPEIRNQGTLGGNLCQRPRCLYYRNVLTPCLRKGGDNCPAADSPHQDYLSIFGGPGCYAVNASDLGPPLIALGARIAIAGASQRELDAEALFVADTQRETALAPDELITSVILPPLPANWRGVYIKGRERTAGDFPVVSVALGYELVDGRIRGARVVLGGVYLTPKRSLEAEGILEGQTPDEATAQRAAAAALAGATPLPYNADKIELARVLIARAIARLAV